MDIMTYSACKSMIADLGTVFTIKGSKSSTQALPPTGNKTGDVWLVGPKTDESYDEYYWSSGNAWELLGSTVSGLDGKEDSSNKVTSLSNASTDTQYPSAKCVYDLVGDIESLLGGI